MSFTPALFSSGEMWPPVPTEQDRWATELVWTLWRGLPPAGRRIPIPQSFVRSLVAIPTELRRLYYITYGLSYFKLITVTAAVQRTARFSEHSTMNLVHFRNCDHLSSTKTIHCLCPLFPSFLLREIHTVVHLAMTSYSLLGYQRFGSNAGSHLTDYTASWQKNRTRL
jgi:hypothetical protein